MNKILKSPLFRFGLLLAALLFVLPMLIAGSADPASLIPFGLIGMAVATAEINTAERLGVVTAYPLAAATKIYAGTLVALDASGDALPAADTAGLRVVGLAQQTIDNSAGLAGALKIAVKKGVFQLNNSAGDAVDANDKGKLCYVEDDNTVSETGGVNKVKAGRVLEVGSDGVWVDTDFASVVPVTVALGSTDGTAAAAADLAALKAESELIGDDVRAIHAALVAQAILK
jgi:hypothetical protein